MAQKTATTGTSRAQAMCIGALSFATSSASRSIDRDQRRQIGAPREHGRTAARQPHHLVRDRPLARPPRARPRARPARAARAARPRSPPRSTASSPTPIPAPCRRAVRHRPAAAPRPAPPRPRCTGTCRRGVARRAAERRQQREVALDVVQAAIARHPLVDRGSAPRLSPKPIRRGIPAAASTSAVRSERCGETTRSKRCAPEPRAPRARSARAPRSAPALVVHQHRRRRRDDRPGAERPPGRTSTVEPARPQALAERRQQRRRQHHVAEEARLGHEERRPRLRRPSAPSPARGQCVPSIPAIGWNATRAPSRASSRSTRRSPSSTSRRDAQRAQRLEAGRRGQLDEVLLRRDQATARARPRDSAAMSAAS